MDRVVLDTNVLVGGAYDDHSASWRIIQSVLDGEVTALVSQPVEREYATILRRAVRDDAYHGRMREFLRVAERVEVGDIPPVVADDPDDDKFLATAVAGRADAVVSADDHLLRLDPYEGLRILTPRAFLEVWRGRESRWDDFADTIGIRG